MKHRVGMNLAADFFRDYALHKSRLEIAGFQPFQAAFHFLRLAGFFGLIFDTRRVASSKSMSSFKPPVLVSIRLFIFSSIAFNGK